MEEEFLHFIWLYQLFDHNDLTSINGEEVQIIQSGIHNTNSGPDFSEARILIGGNLWIGNVEIHVNTSDWFLHQHQFDAAYSNVILHVVYNHNAENWEIDQSTYIPLIELKKRVDLHKYHEWKKLKSKKSWIPCESLITNVPSIIIYQMINRMAVERLERKVKEVEIQLYRLNGNWENALMQSIVSALGSKVNKDTFHSLALILPFTLIKRFENEQEKLDALIFGIAGFLDGYLKDNYPRTLQKQFSFLRRKYDFINIKRERWKFMRMRPSNFPTVRLGQLSSLLSSWTSICDLVFYEKDISLLEEHFRKNINPYWDCHYRFDVKSSKKKIQMGKSMYNSILINSIVPFMYAFGKQHDNEEIKFRALSFLETIKPEKNSIIEKWNLLIGNSFNALESQGLIELKNNYCSFKKCLSCKAGIWILNNK